MQEISSLSVGSEPIAPPKAFISYSWTSPGHQEQVRQWAERLLSDGIEVIIDVCDLKEGHDKYSFMERMVVDKAITHVLVVCDKSYAEKADAKKAGVGTESQIISSEVYAKVDQTKFIPIACEFSNDREPFLPVFLKSRIWIDFSSPEATNQNWEQLVRLLHGRPAHQKPQLGKPPAYITANAGALASPAIGKFATFRQAFLSNAKGLNLYRDDFLSACIESADALRVRTSPDSASFGQKVLEDCGSLKNVRNQIIDWILLESGASATDAFRDSLIKLLEDLRELKARPAEIDRWNEAWFEAHSVFVYETFLYIIAALLKTASYKVLHDIFTTHYLRPKPDRYGDSNFDNFGCFYGYSESLQSVLGSERQKLYSPAAELIKRQADRADLTFAAVIEAELLVLLLALITSDVRWFPQTSYYNSQSDFPFFVRATQHRHFLKLATITGITDADALREAVKVGYKRLGVNQWPGFAMLNCSLWHCMNIDKLDSLK
jgi:TIR domain